MNGGKMAKKKNPSFKYPNSWKDHLHPNTLAAYYQLDENEKQEKRARVYEFVLKACAPGAKWKDHQGNWHEFDGGVCYKDLGFYFGHRDDGTKWRPVLHWLKFHAKALTYHDTRQHPLTGRQTDYFRPRKPGEPEIKKPPGGLETLRWVIPDLRELAEELDENDEWTTKLLDILYDPQVIEAMQGRNFGASGDIGSDESI
jgi:hypothetical protein